MEIINKPLISIIIITYNSANFVLDTLDSAKNQTYNNIELIIADDGSKDDTIKICKNWLSENRERFINSEIITTVENTGIPANCNRGVRASKGEWIKLIAGDDILQPQALQSCIEFARNKSFKIFVSKMEVFDGHGNIENQTSNYNKMSQWFTKKNQIAQKKSYIRVPIMLNIPTLFYTKELLIEVGMFDEEIKLLEDQPFLLKVLIAGYQIGFNNALIVRYRKHNSGVMQKKNMFFIESLYQSFVKYREPELKFYNLKDVMFSIYQKITFFLIRNNYDQNKVARLFLRMVNILVKWS